MAVTKYNWEQIQADYEAGQSMGVLSRRYGVNKSCISRRAKAGAWERISPEVINQMALDKLNGIEEQVDPRDRKAVALNDAIDRRVEVVRRHQHEWDVHKQLFDEVMSTRDFETAKLAKITAETLKIRQESERQAWGIDLMQQTQPQQDQIINIDFSHRSQSDLIALVRASYDADSENN